MYHRAQDVLTNALTLSQVKSASDKNTNVLITLN
ncbi:rCG42927, isoform CRA_b [Rattus norvegicus]|uniref:RCG42927, isoform CRA_b n=1 Tax=Rattus norvegicus TaxID=10116 RepID=A6JZZ1_RAT|nr:rCG42927, isoform CRA_b [Rattus norvegicus]EDL97644.1 rCG42927, isoform CRA_b [Rattus norvegicus]